MALQVIQPANVHDTRAFAYSHAVRMGGLIFVAGQVAIDQHGNLVGQGDLREQTERVFRNLAAVLRGAGSGMEKVGKLDGAHDANRAPGRDPRNPRADLGAVGHFPASPLAVVSSLASPDWLVEIEAVALA